ncbi:MAG: AcrR family transcriptional regulator [Bacteriovoracaceae bacterium]|jgi:AcrR family transcriptional regulator
MSENLEEKEEVHFKICNSVLKLEVNKGHLKWTISEVSKDSGVTRSLIYYYFGKEKTTLLEEAYRYMVQVFFNVNEEKSLGLRARMKLVLKNLKEMPYAYILFFLERKKDTEAGALMRKAEEELFRKLKIEFPELTEIEIIRIYILELGSVAYGLEPDLVDDVFKF